MSIKDLSSVWDEAAQRALETSQETEIAYGQLTAVAGIRVRSGLAAGDHWDVTYHDDTCSITCPR